MSEQLITYILENGGIWGFLFTLSTLFNVLLISKPDIFKKKETAEAERETVNDTLIKIKGSLKIVESKILHLEELHSVKDEDGVPVWYTRKSFIDSTYETKSNSYKLIELTGDIIRSQAISAANYDDSVQQYKELINEYHSTLRDLVLGVERLKIEIESRGR